MVDIIETLLPWAKKDKNTTSVSYSSLGTSGTDISGGYFSEEYLYTLRGQHAAEIFDQMRRSDAQVKMLTSLVKNPIKSASWIIEPVDDSLEEERVAEFIEHVLFDDICYPDNSKRKTWTAFLHECLSMIDFGHSVFEIVHKVVTDHPVWGSYIGLKDLSFRSQKTIEEWELNKNGSIKCIRQSAQGDLDVDTRISGDFLLVFSCDKEGDNYEGISLLRPIYGNWFRKNQYRKIQATGLERAAIGVPYARMMPEVKDKDGQYQKMKQVLNLFRSNPKESLVTPGAFEIGELKISHDSEKLQNVINSENSEMAKSFMATFMEMGTNSNGGAYALGTDISDIFLSGIQLYAKEICDIINVRIIKQLVDMKFGFRQSYPKLKVSGINDKAGKELAEVVSTLANGGMIQRSDRLTQHMHKTFGLPDTVEEETNDNEPESKEDDNKFSEYRLSKSNGVSKSINDHALKLESIMREELEKRSDQMLSTIENILRKETGAKRRSKALSVGLPNPRAYAKKLKEYMAVVADEAREQVLKELDMQDVRFSDLLDLIKKLPPAARRRFQAEIELIIKDQDHNLEKMVFFSLNNEIDRTDSVDALMKEMKENRDKYIRGSVIATASKNFVSNMVNGVRNDVFQAPEVFEQLESFVFRNSNPKSHICKNLNGRVFSKEEYKTSANLPPLHHNCDSYIEAQTLNKNNNRPVNPNGLSPTGTPEEIERILRSKSL